MQRTPLTTLVARGREAADLGVHSRQAEIDAGSFDPGAPPEDKGDSDGTVICTELVRQGLVPEALAKHSSNFAEHTLHERVHLGYTWWGIPAVKLMRKSKLATKLAAKLMPAWAKATQGKFTILGWLARIIGEPMCFLIGLFRNKEAAYNELEQHKSTEAK